MAERPTYEELEERISLLEKESELRKRAGEINSALFKISNAVNLTSSLGELFKTIHLALSPIIDTTNFFFALLDKPSGYVTFPFLVDTVEVCFPPVIDVHTSSALTAEVIRTGKPVMMTKAEIISHQARSCFTPASFIPSAIWLGVPLKNRGEIIGVMAVQNYHDPLCYDQTDMDVMVSVADQVAMVLVRKQAEDELKVAKNGLEQQVIAKTEELAMTQKSSILALASLAEYYDSETGKHLERIQRYVETLLDHCQEGWGISVAEKEQIVLASVLHDAGKTAVPAEILTKPSRLTEDEFEQVKYHTIAAGDAFEKANNAFKDVFDKNSYLALARDIALYHHEKWDGTGYPGGLKGNAIPFPARIIAIADVYDALTSQRPYKHPWTHEVAYNTIVDDSGKQFDPALVEVFKCCAGKFQVIAEQ